MHVRIDAPNLSPDGARRLLVGGLDHIWTRHDTSADSGTSASRTLRAAAQTAA